MKNVLSLSILLSIVQFQTLYAQQTDPKWEKCEYLIGDWNGEGKGNPGMGSGSFSFRKELSQNVLVRNGHTEFPATILMSHQIEKSKAFP